MTLESFGELTYDASLEKYNTYGIKTSCKYLIKPKSIEDLKDLIIYLDNEKIKYFILGRGSNVILPDNSFNGAIISLEKLNNIEIQDNLVTSAAGVLLNKLVRETIANDLEGLEYLIGIPGSLGGAIYGNAGVKESTISDYLEKVLVIRNHEIIEILKKDLVFNYRYSNFQHNHDIIVAASFKLKKGNKKELEEKVKENKRRRQDSQPIGKSAGSVFKNPSGDYAGRLIDSLNLKGYQKGDAYISLKHANFILNKGNATSKDIKDLIAIIQEKVMAAYGIKLELEQKIIEWD